jgi:hypothetical protein
MSPVDVVLIALAAAAILAALELAGRAIAHVQPEPLRWHDLFTQRREDQMRALSRDGGVDIVVVGASDVLFSVDADIVAQATGRSCYNASIYRAVPTVTEAWLRDRVLDLLRPAIVVLGIEPVAWNDDGPLTTRLAEYRAAPVFHADLLRRLHWALGRYSFALRYVGLVGHPRRLGRLVASVLRRPDTWRSSPPLEIDGELDVNGRCLTMLDRSYGHGRRMLDLITQQAGPGFRDGGEQRAAFLRSVELLKSRGIIPIVSISPTCAELIDGLYVGGREAWDAELHRIRRMAEAAGAAIIDAASGVEQPELFADMLHTNGAGQAEFSRRLGTALAEQLDQPARVPVAAGHG